VEHPSEDLDGYRFDALQVAALVRLALREDHWAEVLEMVRALRRKDLAALLPIAEPLVSSRYRRRRRVGAVLCGAFAASPLADRAETLLSSLVDDKDLGVASAAVVAMGTLGRFSKPEYINQFRDHPDFLMRWARQEALARCAFGFDSGVRGDPAAADGLIGLVADSRDPTLAASAALALATLVALDGGAAPEVIDALRGHLHHPNPEVRKHARWGLREWRKQQAGTGPGDVTPGASGP
jgi:HEAT repeat protein